MSKIALQGHVSGTGTIYFSAPNTNTDRTYTLPDATGTVMVSGNMPAFSAYLNANQTGVSASTWTKVRCDIEVFDTASVYDNTTNYRFVPNVAGYYQVTANLFFNYTAGTGTAFIVGIYKNGSSIQQSRYQLGWGNGVTSALIYMNGTTDYLELYGWMQGGTSNQFDAGLNITNFSGILVRAA